MATALVERPLTRPDSPKVTREKKSRDFDVSSVRSPRSTKRERGETSMQKMIHDMSTLNFEQRYLVENEDFAKGAYGKILLAVDRVTKQKVVMKKIAHSTPIRMVNNEVRAGQFLGNHPNIASFFQYTDKPECHYMIFQFVDGQDMFTYLEKLNFTPRPDSEARLIVSQILEGLSHIHSRSIAHRDIKLENLLITKEKKVYVIDFGLCAFIEPSKPCKEWCGSDNYLAPEIVRRTPYDGYKADVFSTGVVLFALLFGVFPFENLRVNGYHSNDPSRPLKKLSVRFPVDVNVSKAAKDLLVKMLEDDPVKRISVEDILKHEWMNVEDEELIKRSAMKVSCEAGPMKI